MTSRLTAKRENDSLVISGLNEVNIEESWTISSFKDDYFFVRKEGVSSKNSLNVSYSNSESFIDLLIGLSYRKWSGGIQIDTGFGRKKLYFRSGELIFASSDLIDDRLGEVSYRRGVITLDELTESATKVTRTLKFGQVLVRSGVMTDFQLLKALKEQIIHIVRSIFVIGHIYYELDVEMKAPGEVVFTEGTSYILEYAYGYGSMYRNFISSLKPTSLIMIANVSRAKEGTFLYDLTEIIGTKITVEEFCIKSKLQRTNILAALMELVIKGICIVEGSGLNTSANNPQTANLEKYIRVYETALKLALKAFDEERKAFPVQAIHEVAETYNSENSMFHLDSIGNLSAESKSGIYSMAANVRGYSEYFEIRCKNLIAFLLQITGDHLGEEIVKQIKAAIKEDYP